jgi:hypothetical protein
MKTRQLIYAMPFAIGIIALAPLCAFNSGAGNSTASAQGQASSVGSPGELGTCSRSTCHGAGNGNGTTGGLPDNAGPGTLTLTSVPAMTNNNYVPNQVYHMTVTIAETGVAHFGFGCEMLDNTGSTNGHINNTAGTVTVTDAVNTRIWQAYGSGRLSVTHSSNGGYSANSCSFIYDWTAPASGTVNVYLAANATNNNGQSDAADNVYTINRQLTPLSTGIAEKQNETFHLNAFPIPARDHMTLSLLVSAESEMCASLVSLDGHETRILEHRVVPAGEFAQNYSLNDLAKGVYFLRVNCGNENQSKLVVIE